MCFVTFQIFPSCQNHWSRCFCAGSCFLHLSTTTDSTKLLLTKFFYDADHIFVTFVIRQFFVYREKHWNIFMWFFAWWFEHSWCFFHITDDIFECVVWSKLRFEFQHVIFWHIDCDFFILIIFVWLHASFDLFVHHSCIGFIFIVNIHLRFWMWFCGWYQSTDKNRHWFF